MIKGLFLIGLVVAAQIIHIEGVTLQSGAASIIMQLKEFNLASENGKQFVALLQLKLEQGSQVEEVLDLIKQLLDQLRSDQQLDELEHTKTMTQYTNDVELLETSLEQLSQDLADTNTLIGVLNRDISGLEDSVSHLGGQLEALNGKEEEIRNARAQDEISYNHRVEQNTKVSQALTTILGSLSEAVLNESDREGLSLLQTKRDSIVDKLRLSLGANHPITILLGVTTRFDIPVVVRIIEKLENIQHAITASQSDDDSHEVEAIVTFNTLVQQISDLRDALSDDLNSNRSILLRKKNELVIAMRTVSQLIDDVPITQSILDNTRSQSEQCHAAFSTRQHERADEITIIQSAFDLINNQVDSENKRDALISKLDA